MSAKKHVSRNSAESRWQEGIFLGILGGGVGASDYAIGTPEAARAIKMVLEIDAWDIELLLAVKGLPWDRRRADPAARIRLPAPQVPPERVLPPASTVPAVHAITAGTTAQGHSDECRARIEQKMHEDTTGEGAIRLQEAIRRKRARPDDEGGRPDVAMEGGSKASRSSSPFHMVVPVRHGR